MLPPVATSRTAAHELVAVADAVLQAGTRTRRRRRRAARSRTRARRTARGRRRRCRDCACRTSFAASMPSFWKFGGMRMSVTTTCGLVAVAPATSASKSSATPTTSRSGCGGQQRPHALAHQQRVVGEEHGDARRLLVRHDRIGTRMRPSRTRRAARMERWVLAPLPRHRAPPHGSRRDSPVRSGRRCGASGMRRRCERAHRAARSPRCRGSRPRPSTGLQQGDLRSRRHALRRAAARRDRGPRRDGGPTTASASRTACTRGSRSRTAASSTRATSTAA